MGRNQLPHKVTASSRHGLGSDDQQDAEERSAEREPSVASSASKMASSTSSYKVASSSSKVASSSSSNKEVKAEAASKASGATKTNKSRKRKFADVDYDEPLSQSGSSKTKKTKTAALDENGEKGSRDFWDPEKTLLMLCEVTKSEAFAIISNRLFDGSQQMQAVYKNCKETAKALAAVSQSVAALANALSKSSHSAK